MAKILDHCMTLVPLIPAEHESVDNIQLHPVLFGGDQLTVARMRGTQDTEETPVHRLQGIVSVIEDWHARVALLKVYFILHLGHTIPGHFRYVITYAALHAHMYWLSESASRRIH